MALVISRFEVYLISLAFKSGLHEIGQLIVMHVGDRVAGIHGSLFLDTRRAPSGVLICFGVNLSC